MNISSTNSLSLIVNATNLDGDPVGNLDGQASWSITDSSLGSVLQDPQNIFLATFTPSGKLGSTQINFFGKLQGGPIQGIYEITVIDPAQQQKLQITFTPTLIAGQGK